MRLGGWLVALKQIRVDDLSGETDTETDIETVIWTVGDKMYRADFGAASRKRFADAMAPFVDAAQRITPATSKPVRHTRRDIDSIRAWGEVEGIDMPAHGMIPQLTWEVWRRSGSPRPNEATPA